MRRSFTKHKFIGGRVLTLLLFVTTVSAHRAKMSSPTKQKFHCWVCDGNGDVYCNPDIFSTSTPNISRKTWKKVGEGFSSVAAGYSGMVCAIKGGSLYHRAGVTCRQPAGSTWEDCSCDAVKVLVGTRYIVRQTSSEDWYYANGLLIKGVFDWNAVGLQTDKSLPSDMPASLSHYTINSKDHLYAIAGNNLVVSCDLTTTVKWRWLSDTFSPNSSYFFKWLWREDSISGTASSADNNLWCLSGKSLDIWELVVSHLESTVRCNWNSYPLPFRRSEVLMFEACKVKADKLYFVLKQASSKYRLVLVTLASDDRQQLVDVPYPGTWPCKAFATCRLPVLVEDKVCCEDGTCGSCASLKRPRERVGEKNLNGAEPSSSWSPNLCTPQPKRRKIGFRGSLVSGVKVKCEMSDEVKQVSMY